MGTLHAAGWRQGSIIRTTLPSGGVVLTEDGRPTREESTHDAWVVATQDCDLDRAEDDHVEPRIELRPLLTEAPPADWGIRNRKFMVRATEYIHADFPRTVVSAAVLTSLVQHRDATPLSDERRTALATWLGYRYNRPAVPDHLGPLAYSISEAVRDSETRPDSATIINILMEFDDSKDPFRFKLIALVTESADQGAVRAWLAELSQVIPGDLGVAADLIVATKDKVSFALVEGAYAADVTQLTWAKEAPEAETDPSGP